MGALPPVPPSAAAMLGRSAAVKLITPYKAIERGRSAPAAGSSPRGGFAAELFRDTAETLWVTGSEPQPSVDLPLSGVWMMTARMSVAWRPETTLTPDWFVEIGVSSIGTVLRAPGLPFFPTTASMYSASFLHATPGTPATASGTHYTATGFGLPSVSVLTVEGMRVG